MKRVATAVVLIPLVLLAVFRAPWWLFALLVVGLIVLALHEYLAIVKAYGIVPQRWLAYVSCVLAGLFSSIGFVMMFLSAFGEYMMSPWPMYWLPFLLFGIALIFRRDLQMALPSAAASGFAAIYIAAPLGLLGAIREVSGVALIFVLLSVWVGDTAAYYVGRNLGRYKLAPAVSPNKTWEGAVASVIGSIAVAALIAHFRAPISQLFVKSSVSVLDSPLRLEPLKSFPWLHVVIVGTLTNVAAQFGDLFESAIKRGAQMKDSGSLLPGHGGILDRIDGLLFATPVVWLYVRVSEYLHLLFGKGVQPLFTP